MRKGALSIKSVWAGCPEFRRDVPGRQPKVPVSVQFDDLAPCRLWLSEMVGVLYVRVSERVNANQCLDGGRDDR